MAVKAYYHDIDLQKCGQLINARLHNVTTAEETTLAATLGTDHVGLKVYNTTTNEEKIWDGTQFNATAPAVSGDVVFKGIVSDLTATGTPASPEAGHQYIAGAAGTVAWTGITLQPSADVQVGDTILFTSATEAYVQQRNDVIATTTVAGNILLATQAQVNAGTSTDTAITPETLAGWASNLKVAKVYTETLDLAQDTAATISHNLNLQDRNAFSVNVMKDNSQISVDVDSVDVNSITLTSCPAVTGVTVTVIGY